MRRFYCLFLSRTLFYKTNNMQHAFPWNAIYKIELRLFFNINHVSLILILSLSLSQCAVSHIGISLPFCTESATCSPRSECSSHIRLCNAYNFTRNMQLRASALHRLVFNFFEGFHTLYFTVKHLLCNIFSIYESLNLLKSFCNKIRIEVVILLFIRRSKHL